VHSGIYDLSLVFEQRLKARDGSVVAQLELRLDLDGLDLDGGVGALRVQHALDAGGPEDPFALVNLALASVAGRLELALNLDRLWHPPILPRRGQKRQDLQEVTPVLKFCIN